MSEQEYISTGVLELYALDMLGAAEKAEVEQQLLTRPSLLKELHEIERSLEQYAAEHRKEALPRNKQSILKAISAEEKVLELTPAIQSNNKYKWLAMAASLLLLFSIGINAYQQSKLQKAENKVSQLIAEKEVFANQSNQYKTKLKEEKEKLELFQNPNIENIIIKGSELSPESYAFISYNRTTNTTSISGINLPTPSEEMQYQLWALVDGKPIDLGVFELSGDLIKVANTVKNPDSFAVTLEEKGGKPTPNLEQLYLIGNV